MAIRVGTGSWADAEYKALLPLPPGARAGERLRAYAEKFRHVEVNATAYRTPSAQQVEAWVEQTPTDFTFSLKLHRRFSQNPARAGVDEALLRRTRESIKPLLGAERFTCFLLVLPANFAPGKHELDELSTLAERLQPHRIAVELRHRDWVAPDQRDATLAYFRQMELVWVAVDMPRIPDATLMPLVDVTTHPELAYLRCHGRNPQWLEAKSAAAKHHYLYSPEEHKELVARAKKLERSARTVCLIANNHAEDFAPRTALALLERLAGRKSR